jgi:hypothetical protein
MSYWDVSQMSQNSDLAARVCACASQEGKPDPQAWAWNHMLQLAASPGWEQAWASAGASGNEAPGRDPGVISDGMILSAVQPLP